MAGRHSSPETASDSDSAAKPTFWRRWTTWVAATAVTIATGIVVAYFQGIGLGFLNSFSSAEEIGESLSGQDAIKVISMTRLTDNAIGRSGYVVARSVDPTPMLAYHETPAVRDAWVRDNKAVDRGQSAWEIVLEGNRTSPVELTNIELVGVKCQDPPTGIGIIDDSPEGMTDKILLTVNVDGRQPAFDWIPDPFSGQDPVKNFFSAKKITLPRGEKNVLVLQGKAGKHCTWKLGLTFTDGDTTQKRTLSAPGGGPFEVMGGPLKWDWYVPYPSIMCPLPAGQTPRFPVLTKPPAEGCIPWV